MLLYKYRALKNIEYVLDIILQQRLFCSHYTKLNDPFEGLFYQIISVSNVPIMGFPSPQNEDIPVASDIQRLFIESGEGNINICSLSSSLGDVRLWSHYADGHRGVAIEIDFPKLEGQLIPVSYSDRLPSFRQGLLAEQPTAKTVLSCKTKHWDYEAEYRLFYENTYFPIPNMIKTIYFGSRILSPKVELLLKLIPKEIDIYETRIDRDELVVKPHRHFNR